jgi:hypothetical protein
MRDASEYDLFLPLQYNDGRPVEPEKIAGLKSRLHDRFGGLTFFPQRNEGIWKIGNVTFREEIVIVRILAEETRPAREFLRALKEELKADLRQEEVLIVERKVEIL